MIDNIVESNQLSDLQVDSPSVPNLQKQNRLLKIILTVISLLFISTLATLVLLVFLTKKDKSNTQLPTAELTQATTQPTIQGLSENEVPSDWKTYANKDYKYQIQCPSTSIHHIQVTQGDGTNIPYFQEICYEKTNQVTISIKNEKILPDLVTLTNKLKGTSLIPENYKSFSINDKKGIQYNTVNNSGQIEAYIVEVIIPNSNTDSKLLLRGFNKDYFDQILSTLMFFNEKQIISIPTQKNSTMISYTLPSGWTTANESPRRQAVGVSQGFNSFITR